MPIFSIIWRQSDLQIRMVIIILIYIGIIGTWHFAPHMTMLVVAGSLLGGLLTTEPTRSLPARKITESDI